MEVPDPRQVYNGAQGRGAGAIVSDNEVRQVYNSAQRREAGAVVSDIEVVPDTEDEAMMPVSTMADRHAMSDDMSFEDEVSCQPIQVNVVARSCDAGRGESANGHAQAVTNAGAYQGVPATSQQRYFPIRRSETSGRHSRQSDSEASGIMYRRCRRIHESGRRGSGEQRRSFEDLRAELTDELRFQQAMFLSARDQLAAQQNEATEGLRGDMLRIVNENRQVQPQLAQVGGAGVPSTSQIEVRKLEDASQFSHQAAAVQSAQGERMLGCSIGSDDTRGQSSGNALVDAVVGPRHEPVGPCSQYELDGQGIPQVMTGGMPSGIPPGVYFTPEVAPTQQYMTTEPQMIPGGMPSGISPGVYRTPVDAMGHSLVNRQLMTSQLANTSSSQYSPDLFMPAETPYYTAPSTCVRINTPHWSTEVIPSSSQNPNDPSIGRTVADQSRGNSQSQKSQDGQTTESQTKESGRVTKHATFADEKRVLAYDTDATDSDEKAVATDKKSAKKVSSSKKPAKKKKGVSAKHHKHRSRGRSAKSSRLRPGHKKSDSDSDSQSCDDGDKKRKGQSTSGTRPRQSRSQRRRASRSRSTSSTGDKRRASSSTASRNCKSDSDKTESETSSASSSTESDSDESRLSHSKHVLKPPKFDGKTSFESFWAQFQNCAT